MKNGELAPADQGEESLFGLPIAFIGLGTVGRILLDMLRPFQPAVRVYDPYVDAQALSTWPFAVKTSMEDALRGARVVSLHASKTPETYHMVNAEALARLPDGALVVNAGRGAVMDTQALIAQLQTGRLRAVLDVYETEPLPLESPLRTLRNVILLPHRAAAPALHHMTQAVVDDIGRFKSGEPLTLEVSHSQFRLMTQA